MTREKIFNIIQDNYSETIRASREIYKLHLQDKVNELGGIKFVITDTDVYNDIVGKIKVYKNELERLNEDKETDTK